MIMLLVDNSSGSIAATFRCPLLASDSSSQRSDQGIHGCSSVCSACGFPSFSPFSGLLPRCDTESNRSDDDSITVVSIGDGDLCLFRVLWLTSLYGE